MILNGSGHVDSGPGQGITHSSAVGSGVIGADHINSSAIQDYSEYQLSFR